MSFKQIILVSEEPTYESLLEAARDAFTNHFGPSDVVETTGLDFAEALSFVEKMNQSVFTHALSRCQLSESIPFSHQLHVTPMATELAPVQSDRWSANRTEDLMIIAMSCMDRVSRAKLNR